MSGARVEWRDRTGSTQDLIHALGEAGAPDGTAIAAREQVGARGQRGRAWHAPAGGVWMSVLCRPEGDVVPDLLSLRVGLAVARTLEAAGTIPSLGLKWPNDLMLRDRKVAGILCEARWRGDRLGWIAVGIGINVRNPIPAEVQATAARLADADPALAPEDLALPVADAIVSAARQVGPLDGDELAEFGRRDWLRGRRLEAPAPGIAAGVGPDGALLVRGPDGRETAVRAGTVVLVPASSP